LKDISDSLSYFEDNSKDEDYTFGDLRDEVDDVVALSVLGGAVYIDEEEGEIGIHEDIFESALESESYRRGIRDRPVGMEAAALAGGAAGTAGSVWKFLEEGELGYIGTGAASILLGKSALNRIGAKVTASMAEDGASRELDKNAYLENYDLNFLDDKRKRQILMDGNPEMNIFTREEFEGISEE
jgi:hypothetical protein